MNDQQLRRCTASAWQGETDRCRWCNVELPGRRTRWCSDECANQFGHNHWWTSARRAALKRDGFACVKCGVKEGDGVQLQVHHRTELHTLRHSETEGYWWRDGQRIKHGDTGCHHHVDGLVTLCAHRPDGEQSCHHRVHHGERLPQPEQLRIEAA